VTNDQGSPSGPQAARYAPAEVGSLKARVAEDMRAALKARETVRLGTLRMLSAAVTNREVEVGHVLTDDELVEVATREAKRRQEAIEAYEKAGREDRAAREREEKEVLEAYLPARLTDAELDALVEAAVAATGATGPGDMGKVMGFVMGRAKGRTDGRVVQERVRARLG
jgi:uncharacterized protein YqeY